MSKPNPSTKRNAVWCKDARPERRGYYEIKTQDGRTFWAYHDSDGWHGQWGSLTKARANKNFFVTEPIRGDRWRKA